MNLFRKEFLKSKRYNLDLSCIIIDIDHLKKINDNYGHLIGDNILKSVANVINKNIRQEDTLGRYGGEEFLVVLSNTNINGAQLAAEKIRKSIENHKFSNKNIQIKVTVSIGVTDNKTDFPENEDGMLYNADNALYTAKNNNRNMTVVYKNLVKKSSQ